MPEVHSYQTTVNTTSWTEYNALLSDIKHC